MMTALQGAVVGLGMDRPRLVMLLTVLVTVVLGVAIVRVDVDTDPENMLPASDPVRELNRSIKADFGTRDMIARSRPIEWCKSTSSC